MQIKRKIIHVFFFVSKIRIMTGRDTLEATVIDNVCKGIADYMMV